MSPTSRHRDSLALATGSTAAGLLAYAFFALTIRGLGASAAAAVAVLWSYWMFSGAALTFPLQHWITRSSTVHGEAAVAPALPRIGLLVAAASVAAAAAAWLARGPLFHRDDLWFPAMVGLVTLGSALIGVVRGILGGRRRFGGIAASLVAENAVRCLTAGGLVLADVGDPVAYGLCLVAGNLVVLLWPTALYVGGGRGEPARAGNPFGFLAGAGFAQLVNQVVLTSGPVVLTLADGTRSEVTSLFAALALFRAPYIVALGMMPQVTTWVTTLLVRGRRARLLRARRLVVPTASAAAVLAGLAGGLAGPWLLRLVFGPEVALDPALAALVALGCTLAVANLVVMVSALALDRAFAVARAWTLAAVVAVLTGLLAGPDPLSRVVSGFVAAEVAAFVALVLVGARATGSPR